LERRIRSKYRETVLALGGKRSGGKGTASSLYLYVKDVDKAFERALDAGGKGTMPVADMFWGDRFGNFEDPYGHNWGLRSRTQDLTQQEIEEGAKSFYAQMAQQAQKKSA
jgi:uncharacterized glyoxalase superfamily protein PhnB